MKLTSTFIAGFEAEQKKFGTQTALANILIEMATELAMGAGATGIKLRYPRRAPVAKKAKPTIDVDI